MNPEFGYNDTNTNAPHTNVNDSRILLSGGSSRVMRRGNNVIDEMMLEVAKKQLKDYMDGVRKTKPAKKYIDILESSGIISKIKSEMSGGEKTNERRVEEADQWTDYAVRTGDKGIGLARRGYDNFQEAMNPIGSEAKKTAKAVNKMFGFGLEKDIKKQVSPWVAFVKSYAQQHNIPYKDAMKQAAPIYKQLKGKGGGYSRIG